jgi:hypothetical protein
MVFLTPKTALLITSYSQVAGSNDIFLARPWDRARQRNPARRVLPALAGSNRVCGQYNGPTQISSALLSETMRRDLEGSLACLEIVPFPTSKTVADEKWCVGYSRQKACKSYVVLCACSCACIDRASERVR